MKFICALFFIFVSFLTYADEVKVEVNPTRPVAGEVFQAFFRIYTDYDKEPIINFSPSNIEVMGKSNQGVSTRTIYANGNLSVTREITIVYDLVAEKVGTAFLRDITVELGEKKIRHNSLTLTVLKEPEELADVFVMADVPKKNLYIGEGIVVRYYLYSKVPVSSLDIKTYPKLNKFLKRFLQEPDRTERVNVDGQLYLRTQIYAAKLYPEKPGKLKVDPMKLTATYPSSRSGDPFGAFGLNRDFKTKTIRSTPVELNVIPLPEPIPNGFTGLVGKHDFNLQTSQTKLIVNQPLELKLTVSGVGALENLEAPILLKDPALEEFESNGDLKISNADQATKVFDYTFLAKKNVKLPAKELTLTYFDPELEKYVPTKVSIPAIEIAGGGARLDKKPKESSSTNPPTTPEIKTLAPPVSVDEWQWRTYLPFINASLAILAIVISLLWVIKDKITSGPKYTSEVPTSFKKGQFDLGEFFQWLSPVIKKTGKTPSTIIKNSHLSHESKTYFIDLLNANDYKDYSTQRTQMTFKYQSGYFKELSRYIESFSHEDS